MSHGMNQSENHLITPESNEVIKKANSHMRQNSHEEVLTILDKYGRFKLTLKAWKAAIQEYDFLNYEGV